ncbi:MAG: Response regulator MprA [Verrucomicrobiae bacterium]|nr:Response regulator MprA [Verrucomicrobiae bacterium]
MPPALVMRHVLIVEDDFEFADLLTEVLNHDNCSSEIATNGLEALDRFRTGTYDAVICDLMMPRLDGESLFRQVERDFPYLTDKFIFITGQTSHAAGRTSFIYPTGNTLLTKPFDIEDFRQALRELFSRTASL